MDSQSMLDMSGTYDIDPATEIANPVYESLHPDGIRLLRILPSVLDKASTDEIQCEIAEFRLIDKPEYTALSYTWGGVSDDFTIKLNSRPICVRKNLWRFLRQARELRHTDWLWIDAICINQINNLERTHQVNLMSKIYSSAKDVLIWLGPRYEDSDIAMQELSRPTYYWPEKRHIYRVWAQSSGAAIRRLCSRPYWTRLWVLQELILARSIRLMCGDRLIPWRPCGLFFQELKKCEAPRHREHDMTDYYVTLASPAIMMFQHVSQASGQKNLLDLMFGVDDLCCADVRDKVYALLGVAAAGPGYVKIDPDYNVSVSTLFHAVLRCHHGMKRPKTIEEVEDQCNKLRNVLQAHPSTIFGFKGQGRIPAPQECDLVANPLGAEGSSVTLWWASFYGHSAVADLLLQDGSCYGGQLLHLAVHSSNEMLMNPLLKSGGKVNDIDALDHNHMTPLERAMAQRHYSTARLLLDTGKPDTNRQYHKRRDGHRSRVTTMLHEASADCDEQALKRLLDVDAIDANQWRCGRSSRFDATDSVLYSCEEDGRDRPLHCTIRSTRHQMFRKVKAVKLLLGYGKVDVNTKERAGQRPIMLCRDAAIGKLLLNTGLVDIHARDDHDCPPLTFAVRADNMTLLELLLDTGNVDVNLQDRRSMTALHYIAHPKYRRSERDAAIMLKLLLDTGKVDLSLEDDAGQTPPQVAIKYGQNLILEAMLDAARVPKHIRSFTAYCKQSYKSVTRSMNEHYPG